MNWALVDRAANCVRTSSGVESATQNILARLPEESHEEFMQMLEAACVGGQRQRLTITQSSAPMLVVDIVPLQTKATPEVPALVFLYDEDEFNSSKRRLAALARRNEAILRCSMDGFFVVDQDCRFLEVNEAFCRMTGYSNDELMRMRITDLEAENQADGGVPSHTQTGLHHFPTAHRHKNGHIVYLEISVNVLHDNGAKILVAFARDVTDRKRAEEQLARLTREQRLILDSAGEGIVGLDRSGNIAFTNPAAEAMLGVRGGELIGTSARDIFGSLDEPDAAPVNSPIDAILDSRAALLRCEGEFTRADSSRFPVAYSITAMHAGPDVIGAVLLFVDKTEQHNAERERRELEAQISASERLESLGLLAGGIAHDLNNMLTGIQGNASLALSELGGDSPVCARIERVVGACKRASAVVDQILTCAGRKTRETAKLDLHELVHDTVEFIRPTVPRAITLDLKPRGEPLEIEADAAQLQQVITNLLVNAIEAIGDAPGTISASASRSEWGAEELRRLFPGQSLEPGAFACVHVRDTGCGMDQDTARRIFEPFFSTKADGRGLGLAAMRGAVRAHQGGVRVESEVGTGARFTVALPMSPRPATATATSAKHAEERGQPTVLVIDDDDDVRDVLRDVLENNSFDVLTAENGTKGVEIFQEYASRIDVVLLDLIMPGKGGWEVYEEILATRPSAKVIMVSGYVKEYGGDRPSGARPAAIIHKPFMNDALIETIREVIGKR